MNPTKKNATDKSNNVKEIIRLILLSKFTPTFQENKSALKILKSSISLCTKGFVTFIKSGGAYVKISIKNNIILVLKNLFAFKNLTLKSKFNTKYTPTTIGNAILRH